MDIKSISFKNYKAFNEEQIIELKPITILIGKNSSGKSSIAKLFTLLENSLLGNIEEPLLISNNGVVLGSDFRDLIYNRLPSQPISFCVKYGEDKTLHVSVLKERETSPELKIFSWRYGQYSFQLTSEHDLYIDNNGKNFSILFRGFVPIEINDESGNNVINEFNFVLPTIDVDYIGPFRILPERIFVLTGQLEYKKTGVKGENAYSMLGVSKLLGSSLYQDVSNWYSKHFDGWRLEVNEKFDPYIELKLVKNESQVNFVDVGQGMNQALPLVVRANVGRQNSLIILEQPELHLHPVAHGDLAELFARSAKKNNQTFLIETHSENIVLRLRRLIVENDFNLTNDDIVIYSVTEAENGQGLEKITISESGLLSDWPEGVFTENLIEISEMRKALKRKGNDSIN